MTDERTTGSAEAVPEGAKVTNCQECGNLVFVAKLTNGSEILVQPIVVRGILPDRQLVELQRPVSEEDAIRKVVARTATAKMGPACLIPHALVCIRAPLVRTLPPPIRPVAAGPTPRPPVDPKVPPPGHVKVVHDLEIQNGKIGQTSTIIGDPPGDPPEDTN